MLRKLICAGLAAVTLAATSLATTTPAEARWRHHWHGGGGVGLGLALGLGAAGLAFGAYPGWGYRPYYEPGPYYYGPGPYYSYYDTYPACSIRRVHTYWGWRWRRVCY